MPFVKNAWYAASWDHELGDAPLAKTLLGEHVVLYRTADGTAHALRDACPHRFAPLSLGKIAGDRIVCPYHGLEFDASGACVRNPHGKGAITTALAVRNYPLTCRYGMIWIWMGDADLADETRLPPLTKLEDDTYSWVHGGLHVSSNYEMVIDNLLDLTHVEFLHPLLASEGNSERTTFRPEQVGQVVSSYNDIKDEPVSGLFQILWTSDATTADMHAHMHWHAPSNLALDVGMYTDESDGGPKIPSVHLLTPETEDSTHYFWAAGRNRQHGNDQVSGMLHYGTQNAFENEDEPMIRAVRSRMQSNDLFAHRPALLPMDEAAVRARRVLAAMIKAEQPEA